MRKLAIIFTVAVALIFVQICCIPPLEARPQMVTHCSTAAKHCPMTKSSCDSPPPQPLGATPPAPPPAIAPQIITTLVTPPRAPEPIARIAMATYWSAPTETIQLRI
jgi:hypothetical protein